MNINAGKILISSSTLEDANFQNVIIFIAEYNEKGAMGFVINKIFDKPLNALTEFSNSRAFPLYSGGPVDKEYLFFIHQRPDLVTGGTNIIDNIYLGGDFKKAVENINNKSLNETDIKICVGYCGWDKGELDEEIIEGSWTVLDNNPEMVFAKNPSLFLAK